MAKKRLTDAQIRKLLRDYMSEYELDQKSLAEAIGMHESSVSRVLNSVGKTIGIRFRVAAWQAGVLPKEGAL